MMPPAHQCHAVARRPRLLPSPAQQRDGRLRVPALRPGRGEVEADHPLHCREKCPGVLCRDAGREGYSSTAHPLAVARQRSCLLHRETHDRRSVTALPLLLAVSLSECGLAHAACCGSVPPLHGRRHPVGFQRSQRPLHQRVASLSLAQRASKRVEQAIRLLVRTQRRVRQRVTHTMTFLLHLLLLLLDVSHRPQ